MRRVGLSHRRHSNRGVTTVNDVNHESVRPTSLSRLVGMQKIRDQVQVAIDASFADGAKFPHTLLVSEPGLGKSELVNVIKHEMAVECHTILGMSISHISDLNGLLLGAQDKEIVYVTEYFHGAAGLRMGGRRRQLGSGKETLYSGSGCL